MLLQEAKTLKDKQWFAMEYHGIECQQRKLMEEVHELNEAITKYETRKAEGLTVNYVEILTEVADVKNLVEQIQMKYNIDNIEVNNEKRHKIERHFKEMEHEINANKDNRSQY